MYNKEETRERWSFYYFCHEFCKNTKVNDIATAVEDITFDEISVIGPTPGEFLWSSDHMEEWHSKLYVDYIWKEFIISIDFLRNHDVTDVHNRKSYFDILLVCGTTDLIVNKKNKQHPQKSCNYTCSPNWFCDFNGQSYSNFKCQKLKLITAFYN